MFQFPALAPEMIRWRVFNTPGCPIRKSPDQRLFAPPRSLSQLITSFIASESLGIHHTPLIIYFNSTISLLGNHYLSYDFLIISLFLLIVVEYIFPSFQYVKELCPITKTVTG